MAKAIPKIKKQRKEKINYSELAKQLKGFVTFNVDLRKSDKTPAIKKGHDAYNFGERMALLKAARELRELTVSTTFVPIKRRSGESKSNYKKRLSNTRRDIGQQKTHFGGVFVNAPNYAKITAKRKGNRTSLEIDTIGETVKLDVGYGREKTREIYIPVNPHDFVKDPTTVLNTIRNQYKDADRIIPIHSGFRGVGARITDKVDFRRFSGKLRKWSNDYGNHENQKKRDHWLSGFLVVYYSIEPIGVKKRARIR